MVAVPPEQIVLLDEERTPGEVDATLMATGDVANNEHEPLETTAR